MSLATIKTKANTKLAAFADAVQIRQTSYANKNGKCFQLLVTDPVIVGVDTTWVLRTKEGQKNVDDIQFEFNSPVPFQVRVDEWVKKDSYGYSITVVVELPSDVQYTQKRMCTPVIVEGVITGWTEETTAWDKVIIQD